MIDEAKKRLSRSTSSLFSNTCLLRKPGNKGGGPPASPTQLLRKQDNLHWQKNIDEQLLILQHPSRVVGIGVVSQQQLKTLKLVATCPQSQ